MTLLYAVFLCKDNSSDISNKEEESLIVEQKFLFSFSVFKCVTMSNNPVLEFVIVLLSAHCSRLYLSGSVNVTVVRHTL